MRSHFYLQYNAEINLPRVLHFVLPADGQAGRNTLQ